MGVGWGGVGLWGRAIIPYESRLINGSGAEGIIVTLLFFALLFYGNYHPYNWAGWLTLT